MRPGVRLWKCVLVNALMCALAGPASAAAAPDQKTTYFAPLRAAEEKIGALDDFHRLGQLSAAERKTLEETKGRYLQMLGTYLANAGDADGAARAFGWWTQLFMAERTAQLPNGALAGATAQDAIEAIVAQARNHQVVILNEAHHVPQHRVFAARLARELRKLGFDYLACETLDAGVMAPLANGRVEKHAGFYSREPMYGEFLRSALLDKWKIVSYDTGGPTGESDMVERMRLREEEGLENLLQRIFDRDPQAKVFMYVGYDHAAERQIPGRSIPYPMLAEILAKRLGTDPLTIDQATMFAYPERAAEHPLYRTVLGRFAQPKPFVLAGSRNGYEVIGSSRGRVDMQVIHPDELRIVETGRPLWMATQAGLSPQAVPSELLPAKGRRLIQAYHMKDGPEAVPADMVMVEAGKKAPMLMLPPGQYRYAFEE